MGFVDDIRGLPAGFKFLVQGVAALLAYEGGIRVSLLSLPWDPSISVGWLSLPLTVLWFLLVINAINFIDGLDGLAAGVTLFTALVLLASSLTAFRYLVAMGLAAVAGVCLGFLRYNFNPASIFMGDSGSYFLGYIIAALSISGSIKSRAAVAILIPIIALGLPLMDTIIAAVRRFVVGKNPFEADKGHIHHRLMEKGFTQRRAVLLMYGITILFGAFALVLVNLHDKRTAFILTLLGVCIVFGIRKLGYLDYVNVDKVVSYFQDVTDVMGLAKERRSFLSLQIAISEANDVDEMWDRIVHALEMLKMDEAEMTVNREYLGNACRERYTWCGRKIAERPSGADSGVLLLDLPLVTDSRNLGRLQMKKDLLRDPINHTTLGRIEHLRRSAVRKLMAFDAGNGKQEHTPA
jgi:UDP-GlcNAc:undecaprenyl-phosphate GlcNAc-1-phosphate transferase